MRSLEHLHISLVLDPFIHRTVDRNPDSIDVGIDVVVDLDVGVGVGVRVGVGVGVDVDCKGYNALLL